MKEFTLDIPGQRRLAEYFERIGDVLGTDDRRASFAVYATGLLGDGDRKSMEPIAARACPDPDLVDAEHQRLHHFATNSPWSDHDVRRAATGYALSEMTKRESVTHWIVDDTGFLKQGKHSVGVKRQYTGSAGKITNCQIGVSLTVATPTQHLPIDFDLYLPRDWTDDPDRRKEARIPKDVQFQTKPELAIDSIKEALADGVPPGRVIVDTAYGNSTPFRRELRRNGLEYGVAVNATTKVWRLDSQDRRRGRKTVAVAEYARQIAKDGGFRRTTWREGTKRTLSGRFAARRVLPIADAGIRRAEREVVWLLMEWEAGEKHPNKFYFITGSRHMTRKKLVRHIKQRWRTERAYQDLKGQLGLDHFEGRRFRGWHHHVSVALVCYAFIVAEQARHFPPADGATSQDSTDTIAA